MCKCVNKILILHVHTAYMPHALHTHVCMHACTHACTHAHIHTHMHACTHTYIANGNHSQSLFPLPSLSHLSTPLCRVSPLFPTKVVTDVVILPTVDRHPAVMTEDYGSSSLETVHPVTYQLRERVRVREGDN